MTRGPRKKKSPPHRKPARTPAQPEPDLSVFAPLVGLSVEEAERWLREHPTSCPGNPKCGLTPGPEPILEVRPVSIDGVSQVVLLDLRAQRVNVCLAKGRISEVVDCG